MASITAATLPAAPSSPTNRPPGRSARKRASTHPFQVAHPVQRRIAEHRIELLREREAAAVHDAGVETASTRGGHHRLAGIDADDGRPRLRQSRRQCAVAAPEIENALVRPRREQIQDRQSQLRHKGRSPRVFFRIPALRGHSKKNYWVGAPDLPVARKMISPTWSSSERIAARLLDDSAGRESGGRRCPVPAERIGRRADLRWRCRRSYPRAA